jgi:potassium-transporting ATPase ATP-binding subunit
MSVNTRPLFDGPIVRRAVRESFTKLAPAKMVKNPVMFVVLVGSVLTTLVLVRDIAAGHGDIGFTVQIALWLWFTVLFANFAEAMAEGRGKAQADSLRATRTQTMAKQLKNPAMKTAVDSVSSAQLRVGDFVICMPGDVIPGDGEVTEGVASVDESAITGESAPVIRESGGDRSAVTGGTKVLSDFLVIRITANPGETFLDRMIALVEGASRQKTPNEIALTILLSGLTIIFVLAVATLQPFAIYSGGSVSVPVLISLLVCLIPTTIGGLLSAIGIAGMDRLIQQNVIAMSGRSVEAAGDVNTLLLDKTGTITLGNRQAAEFFPVAGVEVALLADRAQYSSLPDETPEGRSIVVLAKERFGIRARTLEIGEAQFVPFSATTRMSGVDMGALQVRKGASDAVVRWVQQNGGAIAPDLAAIVERIAREGGTPLVVAESDNGTARALGVIYLKDVVKGGIRERFARLRAMGIRTVMITGDNPLTAAAIAKEAGVDEFLAEATPEDKMALIKREQAGGRLVAMTGDGTNDAPALAQADVSGEHDRSRFEPHEAHRGCGDRKAAAHDARRADYVFDRERCREIFCDYSGDVRRDFSGAASAERDAFAFAGVCDSRECDFQCAGDRRADPARASRSEVQAGARCNSAAHQSRAVRRRRPARSVRRHQAH